ncbi:MAG: YHYH protein [Rhodospirillales bacterium]|nr:YHYH protein [Rhodospirillales bacterium]
MKRTVLLLTVFLLPSAASGHGIEGMGGQSHAAQKPVSFWNFLRNPAEAAAHINIDETAGYRFITSDGLADHATGQFPNRGNPNTIREQNYRFRIPLHPQPAGRITPLGHQNFGVALNGVPFDPLTAEYWNRDRSSGWNIEAMSGAMNLGLDGSNAHVQPDGAYHYHAMPTELLKKLSTQKSGPVQLGWAADGYPIYAPYGFDAAEYKASYRIKSGVRPSGPGGAYDGTYVQDYEYAQGLGDLDECNGATAKTAEFPDGTYLYVISTNYPFIPRCWKGDPDRSFARGPGGQQGAGQGGGNRPGQGGPGMGGPGMNGQGMGMPPPFGHRPPPPR